MHLLLQSIQRNVGNITTKISTSKNCYFIYQIEKQLLVVMPDKFLLVVHMGLLNLDHLDDEKHKEMMVKKMNSDPTTP